MKIAITGCNGRIGKPLIQLALKRGYRVIGIDIISLPLPMALPIPVEFESRFKFRQVDLKDYDQVVKVLSGSDYGEGKCDGVIHLAAFPNPMDYKVQTHNNNVVLSWNVLRACAELGITRIAQASSVNVIPMVYSTQPNFNFFPINESHPCQPDEPYGLSKLICELQAETITKRYPNLRIASLRLHYSVPSRTYDQLQLRDLNDKKAAFDLWGYVQQDSAADAFLLAITKESEGEGEGGADDAERQGEREGEGEGGEEGEEGRDNRNWIKGGHEAFFITAPEISSLDDKVNSKDLKEKFWPNVKIRDGFELKGKNGFFDCSKAKKLLGWVHRDVVPN